MSIHVALRHLTRYQYDRPVSLSPQVIRLRPAPHCRTPVPAYSLRVEPQPHFLNWQQDPQGNWQARVVFPEKTRAFQVVTDLVAEMSVFNPFDFFLEPSAERMPFSYEPALARELRPYLETLPLTPRLKALLATIRPEGGTTDFVVGLNRRIAREVGYLIRLEPGVQAPEETLEKRSGSCRDSAWLLVQVLRQLGLAARFVSGYLIQLAPDVKSLDGPSGTEKDFTDLHAWAEVYLPGAGWVGLDPTSGLLAGEGHLPVACTPDPSGAAPVTGAVEACGVTFAHEMTVTRIRESPRVTFPYPDPVWAEIEALGHRVDAELEAGDVRLTMGGEPTFVSIDDMDGAEWNTAAPGEHKRRLAGDLLRRLQRRFAPGGLPHHGQGKWYPGESLPRWALGCWWRRDGAPLWRDPRWLADERASPGHGAPEAERFIRALATRLGVSAAHIQPAHEDVWHYSWRERRLPVNVDPLRANLRDPEERERLARLFERGLAAVVGYALPLRRGVSADGWDTGPWFLRTEHLLLIPGDSPMGYRLPLDSLPWVAEGDIPFERAPDPSAPRPPLPRVFPRPSARAAPPPAASTRAPSAQESAPALVRTALCVEPRHGRLHIFLPPVTVTEHYLELVAAVEDTAAALGLPVVLEGATPPPDPRLRHFKVTPDPGVIEVNLQPGESWAELVDITTGLYEDARQARLGTEKFMLDGRHTGTGGGNHIVFGGATPADSPVLRRPDLLASLVAFWNNHPSLSYLFSGLFIGPTSQHPRVDEARHEAVYELEIALRNTPGPGQPCPPWLVDRLFRNLLTDVTGNTHRAEFCIDKLFDPAGGSGRLGLVELRSFEMPPHARMSLTQQLLLRTLIAWFWKTPYTRPLVRWETQLHDRFMLPHFVRQDFDDVLLGLRQAGYPVEPAWFDPHFEFRFPLHGAFARRGVEVELRHALEPWNVMGEEGAPGGAVRFVDSSVERVQVKVRGMTDPRHALCCNGRRVPLHPTGVRGEFVAGIRFRAWQPPSCLHPTIGVHAPLVLDLVDTWNGRSIGGCTYHVAHPAGRNYGTFPVNAYEAESRRLARFLAGGHTPGPLDPPAPAVNGDFPFTLDLRRE